MQVTSTPCCGRQPGTRCTIRDGDRGEATKCILRAIRHEEGQPLIDPYVVYEAQMDQWKDDESTVIPAALREGRTLYAA